MTRSDSRANEAARRTLAGSRRCFLTVAVMWLVTGAVLTIAVGTPEVLRGDGPRVDARLVDILALDTLAMAPSGTPMRAPATVHPAVHPVHVPGAPGSDR